MRAHAPSTLSRWKAPARDARSGPAGGFTLLEILVVVAIISLLAGLGAMGLSKVRVEAQRRQTMAILQVAATAATEYQAQTGQVVDDGSPSGSLPTDSIEHFVDAILSVPEAAKVLRTLDDALVDEDNDNVPDVILDAWGNRLEYRKLVDTDTDLPRYHRPYLASAGPDGQWGDATASGGQPDKPAKDNLYSFNLD